MCFCVKISFTCISVSRWRNCATKSKSKAKINNKNHREACVGKFQPLATDKAATHKLRLPRRWCCRGDRCHTKAAKHDGHFPVSQWDVKQKFWLSSLLISWWNAFYICINAYSWQLPVTWSRPGSIAVLIHQCLCLLPQARPTILSHCLSRYISSPTKVIDTQNSQTSKLLLPSNTLTSCLI